MAVAILNGTAITSAIKDETAVPKINGNAPKCSVTGSQVEVTRKWNPNFSMASDEPRANCQPTRNTNNTTTSAMVSAKASKALSPNLEGGFIFAATAPSSPDETAGLIA